VDHDCEGISDEGRPTQESTSGQDQARTTEASSSSQSTQLPKGGGAIRGIGERFAPNPVNGTGSMSVPIATSPGRSGFRPQLSLSYDSGAGNGPFGFGWSLSLPSIIRKTDKGLPQYWPRRASSAKSANASSRAPSSATATSNSYWAANRTRLRCRKSKRSMQRDLKA